MFKLLSNILRRKYFFYFNIVYLIILFFNINNKTLIAAALIYFCLTSYIFKSVQKSLIYTYLLFKLILVGKTYEILLIPQASLSYGRNIIDYQGHYSYIIIGADTLTGIFMLLWFLRFIIKEKLKLTKDVILFILFLSLSAISSFLSINPTISLFYWLNTLFLFPLFIFLKKNLIQDRKFFSELIKFFSLLVIWQCLLALFQYIKKSPISTLEFVRYIPFESTDLEQTWFRPYGTLSHPNSLANFLLPLTIFFFLSGYYLKKFSNHIIFGFLLGLSGIILTLSRSAWLALLSICLIFSFLFEKKLHLNFNSQYKKILLEFSIILIFLIFIFVLPRIEKTALSFSSGGSIFSRQELTSESVNLIMKYPLFGVGYGMSVLGMFLENPKGVMYRFPTPAHNIYLNLINEIGIFGCLAFFAFLILLITSSSMKKSTILYKVKKKIILASFFSILINGIFQPLSTTTMLYLTIFAALYYVS